jgi:flagellar biosynthesis protein FlhB
MRLKTLLYEFLGKNDSFRENREIFGNLLLSKMLLLVIILLIVVVLVVLLLVEWVLVGVVVSVCCSPFQSHIKYDTLS